MGFTSFFCFANWGYLKCKNILQDIFTYYMAPLKYNYRTSNSEPNIIIYGETTITRIVVNDTIIVITNIM